MKKTNNFKNSQTASKILTIKRTNFSTTLNGEESIIHMSKKDNNIIITTSDVSDITTEGFASDSITLGEASVAATSGKLAHAVTFNDNSKAITTGLNSHAIALGDYSQISVSNTNSIALGLAPNTIAKGALGSWLVLTEYITESDLDETNLADVKAVQVDGINIKPNTYYKLSNGQFVEIRIRYK